MGNEKPNSLSDLRKIPSNIEAEQVLIGSMISNDKICDILEDLIFEDVFYEQIHKKLFKHMLNVRNKGIAISEISLHSFLEHDQELYKMGGIEYLHKIARLYSPSIDIKGLVKLVVDTYLRRSLIDIGTTIIDSAHSDYDNMASEQIECAMSSIYSLSSSGNRNGNSPVLLSYVAKDIFEKIKMIKQEPNSIGSVETGFTDLNRLTNGFQKSDLVVIAARPSMGKTALSINLAINACISMRNSGSKGHAAFFSLEMSSEQLMARVISIMSGLNHQKFMSGRVNQDELESIASVCETVSNLPLFFDDTPALSISSLKSRVKFLHYTHGLKVVFVDYLQLLRGTTKRSSDNRVMEVSEVTQGLKAIAKELNIPIIALSQLSRMVENRDDKKPQLSDLRESGSIEQDADIVVFLYREEYYERRKKPDESDKRFPEWREKMEKIMNIADLIIAKQRNGPIGNVKLFFDEKTGKFQDLYQRG